VSTESGQQTTWLTQEAYDRLKAELEQKSGPGRAEIVAKIEAAREEGDLKENGGYHAAKEEQGKQEARIRQLTQLLRTAQVGEAPESSGVVEPGTVITAVIAGDEERFLIGSREIAGDSELDVFSESSPLGAAILGLKVGDSTSYTAPNGREIAVQVTGVETWGGQ
jgi:transcription elongation factor GreA